MRRGSTTSGRFVLFPEDVDDWDEGGKLDHVQLLYRELGRSMDVCRKGEDVAVSVFSVRFQGRRYTASISGRNLSEIRINIKYTPQLARALCGSTSSWNASLV